MDANDIPDEPQDKKWLMKRKNKRKRRKKKAKVYTLEKEELEKVPEFNKGEIGFKDHLNFGIRRAVKTLTHVGSVAAVGAGIAMLRGVAAIPALTGAGLIAAGSALAMGTEKVINEKRKNEGKEKLDIWDTLIKIIGLILSSSQ